MADWPSYNGARVRQAVEHLRDPEAWRRRVGYGLRWMAETAFSTFKRLFGEHVTARSLPNMVGEMLLKASLYNLFMGLNPAPRGAKDEESDDQAKTSETRQPCNTAGRRIGR